MIAKSPKGSINIARFCNGSKKHDTMHGESESHTKAKHKKNKLLRKFLMLIILRDIIITPKTSPHPRNDLTANDAHNKKVINLFLCVGATLRLFRTKTTQY